MSTSARRRSAARLAAVQTLYATDSGGGDLGVVLRDVLEGRLAGEALVDIPDPDGVLEPREVHETLVPVDTDLLIRLARGADAERGRLDEIIDASLSGDWVANRLEHVLRAILRVAVYELTEISDIPPRVSISEYVDLARAFYEGPEVKLVNAVLDRIGRQVHPDAFAGR
ncbi:transcription antitermination factor NusB [Roseospira visakhapatnamensis]|uniref:Transcription antitermination protein NusB n=1 Tax=Roseospira visakhapatnamensis TaxID=390880 RepID=A0A7W6RA96_9PROT|nr:transcription antitermination factor NusB [Roseospira visakhapatnamensis]MBB4264835.1 N utilization substance protein B [Roseospira visakhapatnamensis]